MMHGRRRIEGYDVIQRAEISYKCVPVYGTSVGVKVIFSADAWHLKTQSVSVRGMLL